jgi:hypothetical protein
MLAHPFPSYRFKKRKAEETAAKEEKERAKAAKLPVNNDESVFD